MMFDAYDPEYLELIREVALKEGIRLHEGVYAAITGPVFFTKSELRMLMVLGADSIGMSTVPEVIVARHRGMRVAGVAVITDIAIPDAGHHADEAEREADRRGVGMDDPGRLGSRHHRLQRLRGQCDPRCGICPGHHAFLPQARLGAGAADANRPRP